MKIRNSEYTGNGAGVGLAVNHGDVDFKDVQMNGFSRGLVISGLETKAKIRDCETLNSTDVGFVRYQLNNRNVVVYMNSWDSTNTPLRTHDTYTNVNGNGAGIPHEANIPTEGYYLTGHFAFNVTPNVRVGGKYLYGWMRKTNGTGHVLDVDWERMLI